MDLPAPYPRLDSAHLTRAISFFQHGGTHLWLVCLARSGLGAELGPVALGVNAALAGIGAFAGSVVAGRLGSRVGAGRVISVTRSIVPLAAVLLVLAPAGAVGWVMTGVMQFLFGLASGAESPNDMGFRNAVTPDRLRGRMNATIRSINWGLYAVGSAAGGVLADSIGYRPTLWIAIGGMLLAAFGMAVSPGRHATMGHTAGMRFRATIVLGGKTATGIPVRKKSSPGWARASIHPST